MATVDVTNDIVPKNKNRPVKPRLSDLRTAIAAAPGGPAAYPASFTDKANRNDLIAALRSLGVDYPN